MEEKTKVGKIVSVITILVLIVAVAVLFYQNTQNKVEVENKLSALENEIEQLREEEKEIKNELENQDVNGEIKGEEKSEEKTTGNHTESKQLKNFKFTTPLGESGEFQITAEKAAQATGFSGASAHIYYLKEEVLYYHNEGAKDVKLATGIIDLKQQGEDIIAVKGTNAKILVENQYIQYQ